MKLINTPRQTSGLSGTQTPYLVFESFENLGFIRHGISTKKGGASKGVYESLNLGLHNGEERETTLLNYKLISESIGFDYKNIVKSYQVHGDKIHRARKSDRGSDILRPNELTDIDGLITNEPEIVLAIYFADCVPVFLADPVKKVIAAVHAGWRGTVMKIAQKAADLMIREYGSNPSDIFAGIGPSICKERFEVDYPVAKEFFDALPYAAEYIESRNSKYYVDLWGINKRELTERGIVNIEISNLCTASRQDLFYSHRISGTNRGIQAGFIQIEK
jgi:YfiH family protein